MTIITTVEQNTINEFRLNTNAVSALVGDPSELATFSTENNIIDTVSKICGDTKAVVAVKRVLDGGLEWEMTPGGADLSKPSTILYYNSNSIEYVYCVLTWTSDNVTEVVYKYGTSSNINTYTTIFIETIAYDINNNVTSITWSRV